MDFIEPCVPLIPSYIGYLRAIDTRKPYVFLDPNPGPDRRSVPSMQ